MNVVDNMYCLPAGIIIFQSDDMANGITEAQKFCRYNKFVKGDVRIRPPQENDPAKLVRVITLRPVMCGVAVLPPQKHFSRLTDIEKEQL